MRTRGLIAGVAVLFLLASAAAAGDGVLLRSSDGRYQIALGKGWEAKDFHLNNVQIGAVNRHLGEYVEIVVENQQDFTNSLDDYAMAKRDMIAMSLDNPRMSPGQRLKINGVDAARFEVHGELPDSGVAVGYVLTVFKSKKHYVQVIGWTTDKLFAQRATDLANLPSGFSENSDNSQ
jgi:hypothetical protein